MKIIKVCKKEKEAVAMAKGRSHGNLYARLETKEGGKKLYRLARQRQSGKRCTASERYEERIR